MRKPPFDNEARACEKGDFNPSNRFLGTTNKRHLRALAVLLLVSCNPALPGVTP